MFTRLKNILFKNKVPKELVVPKLSGTTACSFICECKEYNGWIYEGKLTQPCPSCSRIYKGVYSEKELIVKAVEVER